MPVTAEKSILAKPFLKWAGGKSQLLDEISQRLPNGLRTGEIDTYIEPFVGGGAVFFYIAQNCPSIKHFYLFDINQDLVNCYNAVKTGVEFIIDGLKTLERKYLAKRNSLRKDFYYHIRAEFNTDRTPARLIFLNKTCYNGLYRVNRNNEFNVPFGGYENPTICETLFLSDESFMDKDGIIEKLTKQVALLLERVRQLEQENTMLKERIAQLGKNSSNSSKPSSSDIIKPFKILQQPGKKHNRGGQHGHTKFSRQPFEPEQVDEVIEYELKDKDTVGLNPLDEWFIIQQIALPEKMYKVVEHRARRS